MNRVTASYVPPKVRISAIPLPHVRRAAGCVWRVLLDSNRTQDIAVAEEIAAQAQLENLVELGVFESPEGKELLRDQPDLGAVDVPSMMTLPPHTLGGALARFHQAHELSTKIYNVPIEYTPPGTLAFLLRRIRQSHDIWHVLMNFGVEGHDEILLHSFQLPQTGMPSSVVLMALGSLKHMVLEARWGALRYGLREAYARGRRAAPLLPVYWEREWETPVEALRERLRIEHWTDADRRACARGAKADGRSRSMNQGRHSV